MHALNQSMNRVFTNECSIQKNLGGLKTIGNAAIYVFSRNSVYFEGW